MEKEGAAKKGKNKIKQGEGEQEGIAGRGVEIKNERLLLLLGYSERNMKLKVN